MAVLPYSDISHRALGLSFGLENDPTTSALARLCATLIVPRLRKVARFGELGEPFAYPDARIWAENEARMARGGHESDLAAMVSMVSICSSLALVAESRDRRRTSVSRKSMMAMPSARI